MIKFTKVSSSAPSAPALLLIPGGPGLSSLTLRSLDVLKRSFELYYVDFPGTNGVPYERDRTFDELGAELSSEAEKLGRPLFVVGHSFGGLFAADLALRSPLAKGVACVATPLSRRSLEAAGPRFEGSKSPALIAAGERFYANPTDETFSEWLSEYGNLYFAPHSQASGRELLRRDPSSARFFQNNRRDAAQMEPVLKKLATWNGQKLFVAGHQDGLLMSSVLQEDAATAKAKFVEIPGGNHFVTFDQPELVARAVEDAFIGMGRDL